MRYSIDVPVSAKLGEFQCVLIPPKFMPGGRDEGGTVLPWAMLGSVGVTFKIGQAQTTKRIRVKAVRPGHDDRGWGDDTDESPLSREERQVMLAVLEAEMLRHLARHGITYHREHITWAYDDHSYLCGSCRHFKGAPHDVINCTRVGGTGERCMCPCRAVG